MIYHVNVMMPVLYQYANSRTINTSIINKHTLIVQFISRSEMTLALLPLIMALCRSTMSWHASIS